MKFNNIEEAEEKANEILERFLESLRNGYTIDLSNETEDSEYGIHIAAGFTFVYTTRGSVLARRMIERLEKCVSKMFLNQGFEIRSHLFQEL